MKKIIVMCVLTMSIVAASSLITPNNGGDQQVVYGQNYSQDGKVYVVSPDGVYMEVDYALEIEPYMDLEEGMDLEAELLQDIGL